MATKMSRKDPDAYLVNRPLGSDMKDYGSADQDPSEILAESEK